MKNHWQIKRYAKFACKIHGPWVLGLDCQECIDALNAFNRSEMKRKEQKQE